MERLTILYDHTCPLCARCARWIRTEPAFVEVRVMPAFSEAARLAYPTLAADRVTEVIAVADTGEVYRGDAAWIMCLYVLRRYRPLAFTLSRPGWRPWTRRAVELVARHRHGISRVLIGLRDEQISSCDATACARRAASAPAGPPA